MKLFRLTLLIRVLVLPLFFFASQVVCSEDKKQETDSVRVPQDQKREPKILKNALVPVLDDFISLNRLVILSLLEKTRDTAQKVCDVVNSDELKARKDLSEKAFVNSQKEGIVRLFQMFLKIIYDMGGKNVSASMGRFKSIIMESLDGSLGSLESFFAKVEQVDKSESFDDFKTLFTEFTSTIDTPSKLLEFACDVHLITKDLASPLNLKKAYPAYLESLSKKKEGK